VYSIARSLISRRVAVVAAIMCVTYLPLVWLASWHLTEVLATFLIAAIVWLILRPDYGVSRRYLISALIGAVSAFLALVRPEYGPAVVPIALGVYLWSSAGTRRHRVGQSLVLLAAFALVMAPWTIRNATVAHRFLPFGAESGESLYISTAQYGGSVSYDLRAPDWARLYGPPGQSNLGAFARISAPAIQRARSQRNSGVALGTRLELAYNDAITSAAWRAYGRLSWTQIARGIPTRLWHLWANADYAVGGTALMSTAHQFDQLEFDVLAVLMLLGLAIGLRRLKLRAWPLLLFPLYVTCVHLVFDVEPRYTLPPRPLLLIFAGLGLVWLVDWVRQARIAGLARSVFTGRTRAT
jgi:4-amino-4-deoxy-L-arabinose transferase-like glycosyltransferase